MFALRYDSEFKIVDSCKPWARVRIVRNFQLKYKPNTMFVLVKVYFKKFNGKVRFKELLVLSKNISITQLVIYYMLGGYSLRDIFSELELNYRYDYRRERIIAKRIKL